MNAITIWAARADRVLCRAWDVAAGNQRLYDRGLEPHTPEQSLAYAGIAAAIMTYAAQDFIVGLVAMPPIMMMDLLVNGQVASRDKAYAYDQEQARRFQPR